MRASSLFSVVPAIALMSSISSTFAASFDEMLAKSAEWNSNFNWTSCPDAAIAKSPAPDRLTCANFTVPLDWADETPGQGSIFLLRIAAEDQASKKGSIFVNQGGPGIATTGLIASAYGLSLYNTSGGQYDIIGFDPRGVGAYTIPSASSCWETQEDYVDFFNGTAIGLPFDYYVNFTKQEDIDAWYDLSEPTEKAWAGVKAVCDNSTSAGTFSYVGTAAVSRDIVAMTEFLDGEDADVNFWGFSYGSFLGATLVNMFPDRVGKVIVDGIVDVEAYWSGTPYKAWGPMIEDIDEVLEAFGYYCEEAGPERCAIANDTILGGQDIVSWIYNLTDTAHKMAGVGYLVRAPVFDAMYSPQTWGTFAKDSLLETFNLIYNGTLAQLVQVAEQNDTTIVELLGGAFSLLPHEDQQLVIEAGDAGDYPSDVTANDIFDEVIRVSHEVSGYFGSSTLQPRHQAKWWPYRAVERYGGALNNDLKNKVLIATNTWDPVTPKSLAQKLLKDMGTDNAVLVEQAGYGHATLAQKSTCMDAVYNAYWTNGTLPETNDLVCEVDAMLDELFPPASNMTGLEPISGTLSSSESLPGPTGGSSSNSESLSGPTSESNMITLTPIPSPTGSSSDNKDSANSNDQPAELDINGFAATSDDADDEEIQDLKDTNSTLRIIIIVLGSALVCAMVGLIAIMVISRRRSKRYAAIQQPLMVNAWEARPSSDGLYDPHEKPTSYVPYSDRH